MKTKKLKLLKKVLLLLPLCVVLLGAGCEKDEQNSQCYQGEVVNLNDGNGCNNIIKILETSANSDSLLVVGSRITFDPDLFGDTIKLGDIVYFKVLQYEKIDYSHFSTQPCSVYPQFGASIEFCNN